jgi:hypothetical protein
MKAIPHLIEARRCGMTESEAIRDIASCSLRILKPDVLKVEDAPKHHFGA